MDVATIHEDLDDAGSLIAPAILCREVAHPMPNPTQNKDNQSEDDSSDQTRDNPIYPISKRVFREALHRYGSGEV
jgi:hypothetical protein